MRDDLLLAVPSDDPPPSSAPKTPDSRPEQGEGNDEADRLLSAIEAIVVHVAKQIRRAVGLLRGEEGTVASYSARPATIIDIEAYASEWESFLPASPEMRAQLVYLLSQKYCFTRDLIPNIRAIVGLDESAVQVAYERRYGRPLSAIYRDAVDLGNEAETPGDDPLVHDITSELTWMHLPKGEVLMRQGDPADAMYVLLHGRLAVTFSSQSGGSSLVEELGSGDTVGEFALLTGGVRSATVVALRDSELVELSQEGFERLINHHPRALLTITRGLVQRVLRGNTSRPSQARLSTIAVIPVAEGASTSDFCRRLTAALSRFGTAKHVNGDRVAQAYSSTLGLGHGQHEIDVDAHALVAWLNTLETEHSYVVYEADPSWTPWTARCIRQADRLLLLLPFGAETGDAVVRREVVGAEGVERHLVLVHPAGAQRPQGTRRHLEEWQPTRHYHIRPDVPGDLGRLTRSLLGRGVGLVLGGGGARGFGHIGVMRALEDAGVPIDCVAGTSAGAVMAAEYAMGHTPDSVLQQCRALVRKRLLDYTLPVVSLLAAKRYSRLLEEMFGEVQIEDLWLPFFCVSSNLASADIVVHQRGSLRRAIRASSALPGFLPPLVENGQLLVDGLILNNLPVDVMQHVSQGGPVIAVDVSTQFDSHSSYQYGESISALQTLWNRMNPFTTSKLVVPSILSVIMRSTELHHVYTQNAQIDRASLYLHPPVDDYGTFDVKPLDELVAIGYHYARERIAAWPLLDSVRQPDGTDSPHAADR